MSNKYSEHTLITELHKFRDETGMWPRQVDLHSGNRMPGKSTYQRRFGSLGNAMTIARRTY